VSYGSTGPLVPAPLLAPWRRLDPLPAVPVVVLWTEPGLEPGSEETETSMGEPFADTPGAGTGSRSFAGVGSRFGFGLGVALGRGLGSFAGTGSGGGAFAAATPASGAGFAGRGVSALGALGDAAPGEAAFTVAAFAVAAGGAGVLGVAALGWAPVATALGGVLLALERGGVAARSPRPWLSIQPPATARPTSISSTTRMRPHGRRATIGIDSDGSSSCVRGRGLAAPLDGVDASAAYTAGGALLIARGGGALGCASTGGLAVKCAGGALGCASTGGLAVKCAGGTGRGPALGCIATCAPPPPLDIGRFGNAASSEIF
jgi:hypothetical protein